MLAAVIWIVKVATVVKSASAVTTTQEARNNYCNAYITIYDSIIAALAPRGVHRVVV